MKLLILNDLHIGKSRESSTHPGIVRQANSEALATLEQVVSKLQGEDFDLVIQMGDMIRDVYVENIDVENLKSGLEVVNRLPFEKIHLLGNHELSALPKDIIESVFNQVGYVQDFYGYKDYPEVQIAWVDFDLNENKQGVLSDEKIDWLLKTVKPNKLALLFSHYAFLPQDTKGSFYFEHCPEGLTYANGIECWNKIKTLPLMAVISAHTHWIGYSQEEGIHLITVPAFTENIASKDLNHNPGVFTIIETNGTSLNIKSYSGDFAFSNIQVNANIS